MPWYGPHDWLLHKHCSQSQMSQIVNLFLHPSSTPRPIRITTQVQDNYICAHVYIYKYYYLWLSTTKTNETKQPNKCTWSFTTLKTAWRWFSHLLQNENQEILKMKRLTYIIYKDKVLLLFICSRFLSLNWNVTQACLKQLFPDTIWSCHHGHTWQCISL